SLHPLLSEWPATAIAGNDLLSSIFYTVGLCANVSGRWMPLCLLIVSCGILHPFKRIYYEIAQSFPSNGGTFNLIVKLWDTVAVGKRDDGTGESISDLSMETFVTPLDSASIMMTPMSQESQDTQAYEDGLGSSRRFANRSFNQRLGKIAAAIAGTLSLLSYIATAVVSAASAISYGAGEFSSLAPYQFHLTIGVIIFFGVITIMGLKESSNVALAIFVFHCIVLGFLLISGLLHAIIVDKFSLWKQNFSMSDQEAFSSQHVGLGSAAKNIYFGVCSALLGITGFETSSNYIEQQGPGVFPKTLRNMWWLVTVINPLMGLVTLGTLSTGIVPDNIVNLISHVAEVVGGKQLRALVTIDAVLSLSGGALTAFIGVTGLVVRMTQEGMLPKWIMMRNSFAGTHHWVTIIFMTIACSLFIVTEGHITALGGVFTVAFLSVLLISILGCIALRRRNSPKTNAWTLEVFSALIGIVGGIIGQFVLLPANFFYFSQYFFSVLFLIIIYMVVNRSI
ncbi:hypothetical protein MP638_004951, partial [Amoeboaphelidium occidentale]